MANPSESSSSSTTEEVDEDWLLIEDDNELPVDVVAELRLLPVIEDMDDTDATDEATDELTDDACDMSLE